MNLFSWIVRPKTLAGGVLVTVISAIAAGYGKGLIFDSIEKPKEKAEGENEPQDKPEGLPGEGDFTEVDDEEKK